MSATAAATPAVGGEYDRAGRAANFLRRQSGLRPRVALVLGSGLGTFADSLHPAVKIPYARIPHFPLPTAVGHAGQFVFGKAGRVEVAVMQGRVHLYEGYSVKEVIFPMRVLARLGIRAVILTNAAGGISEAFQQGALVIIRDHINLQGVNPLAGPNDERFGPRFPDMSHIYWKPFGQRARKEARRLGIKPHQGVYAALAGPSYETPAEIRYLRVIGADLVGMSTVPEAIAATHMGIRVLGISCVTNMAAGISSRAIHHEEVLETGKRVAGQFVALLRAVLPPLAQDADSLAK